TCHGDLFAEELISHCNNAQSGFTLIIQSVYKRQKYRIKQFAGRDRSVQRSRLDSEFSDKISLQRSLCVGNETACHPNAVLDLRVVAVMRATGQRHAGAKIELVGQKCKRGPEAILKLALARPHLFDQIATEVVGYRCKLVAIVVQLRKHDRNDGNRPKLWM